MGPGAVTVVMLLAAGAIMADAGYLGSVVQGPVPLPGGEPSVNMIAEDVLITLGFMEYSVCGAFLLVCGGEGGEFYSYFPVDILTPFAGALYSAMEPGGHIARASVSVNGEETKVFPLYIAEYDPADFPGRSWEDISGLVEPLYVQEPAAGEPYCFTRMPAWGEVHGDSGLHGEAVPAVEVQAVNACWKMNMSEGDTVLVECTCSGGNTMDYERTFALFCYPLQTGSTWSGSIGRGRITVVPVSTGKFEENIFAAGVLMPPARHLPSFVYRPLPAMEACPAWSGSGMSRLRGREFTDAVQWEFSDFEPVLAGTGWRSFYPGLGDMYAIVADSLMDWRDGLLEGPPRPWSSSYIYVYYGRNYPERLTVIAPFGLTLHSEPSEDSGTVAEVPMTAVLRPLEVRGDWIRACVRIPGYITGYVEGERTGWVKLVREDETGLVQPAAIPML